MVAKATGVVARFGHGLWAATVALIAMTAPAAADIDNRASVTATAPDGSTVDVTSNIVTIEMIGPADLVTVIAPTGPPPPLGGVLTYDIRITNGGPSDAEGVRLQVPPGEGATIVDADATHGVYDRAGRAWAVDALAVGETATLSVLARVDAGAAAGTEIELGIGSATARNPDPGTDGDVLSAIFITRSRVIVAADDSVAEPVDSALGDTVPLNVFDNDTLEGSGADAASVTVVTLDALPDGLTLSDDGVLRVARFAAPGDYRVGYRICVRAAPDNCSDAEVALEVVRSLPVITGTVFEDFDQNGRLDLDDPGLPDYRVVLTDSLGQQVAETLTDVDGTYRFVGFDAGRYALHIVNPATDVASARQSGLAVEADTVFANRDIAVTPTGIIHDADTGAPVAGARLRLLAGDGTALPDACLLPGQQGQVTGADGAYHLDLVAGAASACPLQRTVYQVTVDPPPGYGGFPVDDRAPTTRALDAALCPEDAIAGGPCHPAVLATPVPGVEASPYHVALALASGDRAIAHNHLPLLPAAALSSADGGSTVGRIGSTTCPAIAGRVFADLDGNGLRDPGEPGIEGAFLSVGAARGVTDADGRYAIPCDGRVPGAQGAFLTLDVTDIAGDLLPLDGATRELDLSIGAAQRVDFAMVVMRVLNIDLTGAVFAPGTADPLPASRNGIVAVALSAVADPSTLRLTYYRREETEALAQARLDAVAAILTSQWADRGLAPVNVDTRIVSIE